MQSGEKEGNPAHACAAFMRENLEGSPYSSMNVSCFKSSYLFGQFLFSHMEESRGRRWQLGIFRFQWVLCHGKRLLRYPCFGRPFPPKSSRSSSPPEDVLMQQQRCVRLPVSPLPLHVRILKGVENYSVGLIDFGFRILGTTWVIDTRTLSTKMAPQERLYAFCSVYPF